MRWPLGPPHLTLKTSKKNKKKLRKTKKHKNTKTRAFQLSFFHFLGGCPKFPLFENLAKKARTPLKHYKNRVSGPFFLESSSESRNGHFWTKNKPNPEIPVIICFCLFLLLQQQKHKISWNPYLYSVWANLKNSKFNELKHRKLKKKTIFAPFFWKRLFFENCEIIGNKKHTHTHTQW